MGRHAAEKKRTTTPRSIVVATSLMVALSLIPATLGSPTGRMPEASAESPGEEPSSSLVVEEVSDDESTGSLDAGPVLGDPADLGDDDLVGEAGDTGSEDSGEDQSSEGVDPVSSEEPLETEGPTVEETEGPTVEETEGPTVEETEQPRNEEPTIEQPREEQPRDIEEPMPGCA